MILRWQDLCPDTAGMHLAVRGPDSAIRWSMHEHDFYEMFCFDMGKGQHLSTFGSSLVQAEQLVCIRPEHAHSFKSTGQERCAFRNVAIRADLVEGFMARHRKLVQHLGLWQGGCEPLRVSFTELQYRAWQQLCMEILPGGRSSLDAEYFLCSILRILAGRVPTVIPTDCPEWLREALETMLEEAHLQEGLPALSRLCSRSRGHVARSFRTYFQETPTQWLTRERIRKAQQLLEGTQLPISEIALSCGMENLSHFHHVFKAHHGMAPRAYRKKSLAAVGLEL